MNNVLFVHLPAERFTMFSGCKRNLESHLMFPLGILYLSAAIKSKSKVGMVGLLDIALNATRNLIKYDSIESFIDGEISAIKFKPDIIAVSLNFSSSYPIFTVLVKCLKKWYPSSKLIIGGTHATATVEHLLNMDGVDYVCCGEGEAALAEMITALNSGRNEINIQGINKRGNCITRTDVVDIRYLPWPDWELLDIEGYLSTKYGRQYVDHNRSAAFISSRGCPFRCIFCSQHITHGRKMRYRDVSDVVEEIKFLNEQYGVDYFSPMDDLFTANKPRTLALLTAISELNIPNIGFQFPNGLSIATTDEDIIDAMVACGVESANFAIETGTEYMQQCVVKKNCDLEKAKRLVKYAREKGIVTRCNFIFGFPGETKEMMLETVQYMNTIEPDWFNVYNATPLIGTEMYTQFVDKGCIIDGEEAWVGMTEQHRYFDTEEITGQELMEFTYRTNLELNFLNNPNIRLGNLDRARMLFHDILFHYPFQIFAWYGILIANRLDTKNTDNEESIFNKIRHLIVTDERAKELSIAYQDLLVGIAK